MDRSRLLDCLDAEVTRLRAAAMRDLAAPVPTCPAWTVEDLVRHVASFYVNVVVRRLRMPQDVPKQDLVTGDALVALDRGYAAAVQDLTARDPEDHVVQLPHETVY
jgi:Mycothiol maleylpyruvate isomerase N-terminal domain